MICPACGELIIVTAWDNRLSVPDHRDAVVPLTRCLASASVITIPAILR